MGDGGETWLLLFRGPIDDYYPFIPSESFRDDIDGPEGIGTNISQNDDVHLFYSLEISTETGVILNIHLGDLGWCLLYKLVNRSFFDD